MQVTISQRRQTSFNLDIKLLERLKALAKRENRSLNNYVECVLSDIAFGEPNDITAASIRDAREGKYVGEPLDPTNAETLLKSTGL